MPTVQERRRFHRVRIPSMVGTLRSPGDAEILDLSLAGVSFEAPGEIHPGDRCYLELHHDAGRASVEVEVRWASVRRVERLSNDLVPVFRAGGAFLEVQNDASDGILGWLMVDPPEAAAPS
jgi:hypothetical protein